MTSEETYKEAIVAELEKAKTLIHDVDVTKCVISITLSPKDQVLKAEARFAEVDDFVTRLRKQGHELEYQLENYRSFAEGLLDPTDKQAVSARYNAHMEQVLDVLAKMETRSKQLRKEKSKLEEAIAPLVQSAGLEGAAGKQKAQPGQKVGTSVNQVSSPEMARAPSTLGADILPVGGVPVSADMLMGIGELAGSVQPVPSVKPEPTAPPLTGEIGWTRPVPSSYLAATMLPKISLPVFGGDIGQWPTFWESFEAAVGASHIPPIQKLTLLMSNLTGIAKEAVDGFPITNDNYELVKQVLSDRFGNRTLIRQGLMTQLIKIPTAQGSVKSMRQTMGQIERICRILESQGLDIENEQVLCTIEAKMPKWMLREVYALKEMFPDRYNVKTLRSIVNAKLRVSEASEFMSGTLDSSKKPKEAQKKPPKAHLFATAANKQNEQSKPKCYLCHQKHWVTDCFAYPDLESRKAQAIKLGLCLKCLGKGHRRANCPKTKPCFYCKGKDHHGALCEDTNESQMKMSVVPDRLVSNAARLPKKGKTKILTTTVAQSVGEQVVPTCLTCAAHAKPATTAPQKWIMALQVHKSVPYEDDDVYLLTRRAQVFNAEMPFLKQKTIVFFDSGSTFSGISNQLAQAMRLSVVKTVDYRLVTYRTPDPESERFPLYEVGMTLADGSKLHLHLAGYDTLPKIDAAHVEHVPVNEEDTLQLEVGTMNQAY